MLYRALVAAVLLTCSAGIALAQPAATQSDAPAAPASQPELTDAGRKNLKTLTDKLEDLEFTFSYAGPQDKPFYTVTLSVADFMLDTESPFVLGDRIKLEQGKRIVELLAASGWLNSAQDVPRPPKVELPDGYVLRIAGYDRGRNMIGSIGFDAKTYDLLAAVRAAVTGEAAKAMDTLLGRISFLKAKPDNGQGDPPTPASGSVDQGNP